MQKRLRAKYVSGIFCLLALPLLAMPSQAQPGRWVSRDVRIGSLGSNWLLMHTDVNATLVDSQGQPSFKPSSLKITNNGKMPCTVSSPLVLMGAENGTVQPRQTVLFALANRQSNPSTLQEVNVTIKVWQSDDASVVTQPGASTGQASGNQAADDARRRRLQEIDGSLKEVVDKLALGEAPVAAPSAQIPPSQLQASPVPMPQIQAPTVQTPPLPMLPVQMTPLQTPPPAVGIAPLQPNFPQVAPTSGPVWMSQTTSYVNEDYGYSTQTVAKLQITKTTLIVESVATTKLARTVTTTTTPLDGFTVKQVSSSGESATGAWYSLVISGAAGRSIPRHRTRILTQDESTYEADDRVDNFVVFFSNQADVATAERVLSALADPGSRVATLQSLSITK